MRGLRLGYWAAQEQYDPARLLEFAIRAEVAGFDIIATSDHFHPWRDTGGQSGFPWVWLAAAAERTRRVQVGTAVTTPLFRYHPAMVAQAFATLDHMYPGRIFLTLGTGHAMNEVPLGFDWPGYKEKVERLEEAVQIILELWKGDFVNFEGKYYRLRNAKIYTRPKTKIPVYLASACPRVAMLAGRLCDGMLINPRGLEKYYEIVEAMERGAGAAGRDPSTLVKSMEFKVSYDVDYDRALNSALFWASTAIPREKREKMYDPREMEASVGPEEVEKIKRSWLITTDPDDIFKKLAEFLRLRLDIIYIHSASPDEEKFIGILGRDILPWMREFYERLESPIRKVVE